MAKTVKANYIRCEKCTVEAEEEVLYHVRAIREEESLFEEGVQYICPQGHYVTLPTPKEKAKT